MPRSGVLRHGHDRAVGIVYLLLLLFDVGLGRRVLARLNDLGVQTARSSDFVNGLLKTRVLQNASLLSGAIIEEALDLLERSPLGLGDEEEHPGQGEEAKDGEEDESAGSVHGVDELGRDKSNDKVIDPDGAGGKSCSLGAEGRGEQLRRLCPGDGGPRSAKAAHEDEDESDAEPRGALVLAPGQTVGANETSDDSVTGGDNRGAKDDQGASANLIHEDENRSASNGLAEVHDTGHDELHFQVHAKGGKQGRAVVDEGVDAQELLEETQANGYVSAFDGAPPEAVDPAVDFKLELLADGCRVDEIGMPLTLSCALHLVRRLHGDELRKYERVVIGQPTQAGQILMSFLLPAGFDEPPRRVGEEGEAEAEEDCRGHLRDEGNAEAPVVGNVLASVGDVVGHNDTDDDHPGLHEEESSTDIGRCSLGYIDGCHCCEGADANAADETTEDELSVMVGGRLKDAAQVEPEDTEKERLASTPLVRCETRAGGPEEGAELEHGRHQPLVEAGSSRDFGINFRETLREGCGSEDDSD